MVPNTATPFPYDSNTILYDPERLEPLDTGGFWLSETPEKHSRSWGTRVARSATWALFGLTNTDLSILHLNTHLDHVSAPARREGIKLIVEKIGEISDRAGETPAIILTGDFNARPGNTIYRTLIESGFVDTFSPRATKTTKAPTRSTPSREDATATSTPPADHDV